LPLTGDNQSVDLLFHTARECGFIRHAAAVREFSCQVVAIALIRAVCLDTRDCCRKRDRLINSGCWQLGRSRPDQNSVGGRLFGAEDVDAPLVPASASANPALVCQFRG